MVLHGVVNMDEHFNMVDGQLLDYDSSLVNSSMASTKKQQQYWSLDDNNHDCYSWIKRKIMFVIINNLT